MPRPLLLLALLLPLPAAAQLDAPQPLVVMNLAAHPDDEDGSTLAYYRYAQDAVAYSVIYTRGEGGQNEAGPDLYERLGAIRTAETERAARILGTQVYYLNFYDFGYSKSATETFAEWSRPRRGFWDTGAPIIGPDAGRDAVTARLVYLIRKLKPDVLFTNHDTTSTGPATQHGHHQAVGISAYNAFALAADRTYHPEQLAEPGVDLWQPQRLFLRQFRSDGTHDVAVPVSDPCNDKGVPCTDLAVQAAAQHVSQGFDKFAPRFRRDTTYFHLLRAAPDAPSLPAGAEDLAAGLPPNPHAAGAPLAYLLASGRLLPTPRMDLAPVEREVAYYAAHGGLRVVPGEEVVLRLDDTSTAAEVRISGGADEVLATGGTQARYRIPADLAPQEPRHRYLYERLTSTPPLLYETDDAGAAGYLPVFLVPPVVVDLDPAPIRLTPGENVIPVAVQTFDPATEAVSVGLLVEPVEGEGFRYERAQTLASTETAATFRFTLPDDATPGRYRVVVSAEASPTTAPSRPYVETRPAAVLPDVSVADGLRVGFVRSYDRVTEDALRAMGAEVVVLDSLALATRDLSDLHTVVLDIRAYLVRPDLRAHNSRLLDWVRGGGHLVVGYHKTFEWNPGQTSGGFFGEVIDVPDEGFAPYPLRLSRARVTREDAPVTLSEPGHILFRAPHQIEPSDWNGWVQERGLYFPLEYDDRYQELLSVSDPGEPPLWGGLLLAEVGAGTYLYSPLVWYRQLEALNGGAWRLFANLVSLPLTDGRGE